MRNIETPPVENVFEFYDAISMAYSFGSNIFIPVTQSVQIQIWWLNINAGDEQHAY